MVIAGKTEFFFFFFFLHIPYCGLLRLQQEARENAVARWTPSHAYVGFGLQPHFFILGDVDRETSCRHLSQSREKTRLEAGKRRLRGPRESKSVTSAAEGCGVPGTHLLPGVAVVTEQRQHLLAQVHLHTQPFI